MVPKGPPPVIQQANVLDNNRIILYKKSKQLGRKDESEHKSGLFIVEISSSNNNIYVAAFDVDSPESLLIELDGSKSNEILAKFGNDYE